MKPPKYAATACRHGDQIRSLQDAQCNSPGGFRKGSDSDDDTTQNFARRDVIDPEIKHPPASPSKYAGRSQNE